jgi:hypothetical protein
LAQQSGTGSVPSGSQGAVVRPAEAPPEDEAKPVITLPEIRQPKKRACKRR